MKRVFLSALFAASLFVGLSSPSSACTVSTSCNNACTAELTCSRPYPPCELFCSASSQTVSCTGNICSGDSTSVTCDGVTKSCPTTSQCRQGSTWVQCGGTTRQCTFNCPL